MDQPASESNPQCIASLVTHVSACSALIYLHVVVSGFNPELPEIRECVSSSIEAFKSLPDPQFVGSLAWPFCITGCLATRREQDFFRDLLPAAGIDAQSVGSCWTALQVMEGVWMRHDQGQEAEKIWDWQAAMGNLGAKVLLA